MFTGKSPTITTLIVSCSASLLASQAIAAVIYVDDTASGLGDGTSWGNAFTKLRPALNIAQPGDIVRVGQGRYCPANAGGSRSLSFIVPEGVSLIGGYAGAGAGDPDEFDPALYETILTGDINDDDDVGFANYAENSFHVVAVLAGDSSTVIRGVTITAGNADGSADPFTPESIGGGVLCLNGASPSIIDCVLELNQAALGGGAIHANQASPLLRRCVLRDNRVINDNSFGGAAILGVGSQAQRCEFLDNQAQTAGGAVSGSGIRFLDCDFEGNTAGHAGGAITGNNLTVLNCTFFENQADIGGAMRCSNTRIVDTLFDSNTADNRGGAIVNGSSGSTLDITGCTFILNQGAVGGAIDTRALFTAVDCLFDRNSTGVLGFDGGAIALRGEGTIINCSFIANTAGTWGGAMSVNAGTAVVANGQFSGNSADQVGGAILSDNASLDLDSCTIVGNECSLQGGNPGGAVRIRDGGVLRIHNTILWANSAQGDFSQFAQVFRETGNLLIANSTLQGWTGSFGGNNNTGADPLFVDLDGDDDVFGNNDDDLRLQAASPARNTGDNALLPLDTLDIDADQRTSERLPLDLAGQRRIRGGVVDRGAFEFDPNAP